MEYYILIAASLIIIVSHVYNRISNRTNIPSVLLLIVTGIICREIMGLTTFGISGILNTIEEISLIELLGTLGLIMIVLEAALDLKLTREKRPLILRAFLSGLLVLIATMFAIGAIFMISIPEFTFIQALVYATPLSILSSAIVIPSVTNLNEEQKEFHIYDSTFSDILGIMLFYFLIELSKPSSNAIAVGDFTVSLILTIAISLILSYLLIYVFQNLESKVKLFVMISVLLLLYSVGKMMHLSSLIVILVFGLILSNPDLFFIGPLKRFLNHSAIKGIYSTFNVITMETAFVVRTFFFFIFGFSVSILAVFDILVAAVSLVVVLAIYMVRAAILYVIANKSFRLATSIAPRGLITLLLFYSIPEELTNPHFKDGILLFVIILTSLFMTYGLLKFTKQKPEEIDLEITNMTMEEESPSVDNL